MAIEHAPSGSTPLLEPLPAHAATPKTAKSAPDTARRLHFLPPALWSANTSSASLVQSEEAAHGEHIFDETTVAYRISALRQINGTNRTRHHRYAKSAGARNSTYNQPVIVRTYSGPSRPRSQYRPAAAKKGNGPPIITAAKMGDLKLPPVEAFSFKGIMDEIKHGVTEDLERIAEICARSKYSLSNQYEVHMPPHGRGEQFFQPVSQVHPVQGQLVGPTLQAIGSDDEQPRLASRSSKTGRRARSAAYGTLETIMSSSRSSDEDKSSKKPAAVLADEVRGRAAARSETAVEPSPPVVGLKQRAKTEPLTKPSTRQVRSRSATFASIVIDNAQGGKHKSDYQSAPIVSLVSEPSRPQTSGVITLDVVSNIDRRPQTSVAGPLDINSPRSIINNDSTVPSSHLKNEERTSLLSNLSAWLLWGKRSENQKSSIQGRARALSHAEGSLREILKSSEIDIKGKGADRGN